MHKLFAYTSQDTRHSLSEDSTVKLLTSDEAAPSHTFSFGLDAEQTEKDAVNTRFC